MNQEPMKIRRLIRVFSTVLSFDEFTLLPIPIISIGLTLIINVKVVVITVIGEQVMTVVLTYQVTIATV